MLLVGCTGPAEEETAAEMGAPAGPTLQVIELTPDLRRGALEERFSTLGDHRRAAVELLPPETRSVDLEVPSERPTLRFAFGRRDVAEGVCLSSTVFRISLRADGANPHLAHEQILTDRGGRWVDGEVPLTSWAGQQVELTFEAWPGADRESHCAAPVAVVGDVRLVSGGADPRPDLWVIVIDAWRADHAGYLADSAPPTPRIDSLAAEAHRFTDAAAPAPWTRESVFALMTGSYATAAIPGTRDSAQFSLATVVPTIPERVSASGYRTLAVYANAVLAPDNGLERGFDAYAYARSDADLPELIDTLRAAADPRRPRLIYAHLISPHVPYCQHEEITDRHLRDAGVPPPWPDCVGELAETRGRTVSEDERRAVRAFYRGEVEFADWVIGRLLDQVTGDDADRPAWVVVTADHGEELWDHGGFEHGHTLYPELLHVPLLIRGPAGHPTRDGGATHETPVSLVDVGDTLLDLAGELPIDEAAGVSLAPMLEGQELDLPAHRTRLACGLIYGPPRAGLLRDGQLRILTLTDPATLESIPAGLAGLDARPATGADGAEIAAFAAEWATYQRLATTGSSVLAVQPADPGLARFEVEAPGDVVALASDPSAAPRVQGGDGSWIFEGVPASGTLLQFEDLGEFAPPPRYRLIEGAAWSPLPHPWSPPTATPAGNDSPSLLDLQWEAPAAHSLPGSPADPQQQRLRVLGYLE